MVRKLRSNFRDVIRTQDGNKFFAEFGDPNATPRPRKEFQNLPHRGMTTHRSAQVQGGDIVTFRGVDYLLLDQHILTEVKKFLAAQITHTAVWSRDVKVIDPVSRVEKTSVPQTLNAALPLVKEPMSVFEEENFETVKYRIYTSADVLKGDRIDDYVVKNTFDLFGVRMAEIL